MYFYLNKSKSVTGHREKFDTPLDPEMFDIGSTEQDYNAGMWVPITEEHVEFMDAHPEASIAEILNMEMTPKPERTIEDARAAKLAEIDAYDVSPAVNGFTLDGDHIWLENNLRLRLSNRILTEEAAGREVTRLWFEDKRYDLPIAVAKQMLAAVELYAMDCYDVTATHRHAVGQLTTIEEIDAYDYTTGYPAQLTLTTPTIPDDPCSDDE